MATGQPQRVNPKREISHGNLQDVRTRLQRKLAEAFPLDIKALNGTALRIERVLNGSQEQHRSVLDGGLPSQTMAELNDLAGRPHIIRLMKKMKDSQLALEKSIKEGRAELILGFEARMAESGEKKNSIEQELRNSLLRFDLASKEQYDSLRRTQQKLLEGTLPGFFVTASAAQIAHQSLILTYLMSRSATTIFLHLFSVLVEKETPQSNQSEGPSIMAQTLLAELSLPPPPPVQPEMPALSLDESALQQLQLALGGDLDVHFLHILSFPHSKAAGVPPELN